MGFRGEEPFRIGLLGAESSGKTTLAGFLVKKLEDDGIRAILVPEYLRTWCKQTGRLPTLNDQDSILQGQINAENSAAQNFPGAVLVCDPAAITTHLYSQLYFGREASIDTALLERYHLLVWCDIDIKWCPDPIRDSPAMRQRMHDLIGDFVPEWERTRADVIPLVTGSIQERLRQAWQRPLPKNSA